MNKLKFISLAVAVAAMAFTLSCSSSDDKNDNGPSCQVASSGDAKCAATFVVNEAVLQECIEKAESQSNLDKCTEDARKREADYKCECKGIAPE